MSGTVPIGGETAIANRPTVIVLSQQEVLGEALLRVPAYRALRLAFPESRIVSLTQRRSVFANALAWACPLLIDAAVENCLEDISVAGLRRLARSFGPVDVVIDLRSNPRMFKSLLALSPIARRYVADVPGLFIRKGVPGFAEVRAHSNAGRQHRVAEIAAGRRLPFDASLPEAPAAAAAAASLLPPGRRYFGFAASSLKSRKSWPRERFVPIAARVAELGLTPVVLLGTFESRQRAWYGENFPGAILVGLAEAGGDAVLLLQLLHAVAGRLSGCIATDGGLGHLVASRGVPLLTLAGPTNIARWRPLTPSWWPLLARDFGGTEMSKIPVAAVEEMVAAMLSATAHGPRATA